MENSHVSTWKQIMQQLWATPIHHIQRKYTENSAAKNIKNDTIKAQHYDPNAIMLQTHILIYII
jgi:hypothetical protein